MKKLYKLQVTSYKLRVTSYKLQVTNLLCRISDIGYRISFFAFCFLLSAFSLSAQTNNFTFDWTLLNGTTGLTPAGSNTGVSASNVTIGSGLTPASYNAGGLEISIPTSIQSELEAFNNGYYIEFSLTPDPNYSLTIPSPVFSVNIAASTTGNERTDLQVYWSTDNWATYNRYRPFGQHSINDSWGDKVLSCNNNYYQALHTKNSISFRFCFYYPVGVGSTAPKALTLKNLQLNGSSFPSTEYEIWNWADLAYLNVLYENVEPGTVPNLFSYSKFKLMQDLGIPGQTDTYGVGGPYDQTERNWGCYGYQNWISGGFDPNTDYSANDLLVGAGVGTSMGRPAWSHTKGWLPIINNYYSIVSPGTEFDGQNHKIDGLWIYDSSYSSSNSGLFGYAKNFTLKNLDLNISEKGIKVIGRYSVAGLVGEMAGGSIEYCSVTGGEISTQESSNTGGLVGLNGANISNCYATNDVIGSHNVGGLVGSGGGISDCYATGDVTAWGGAEYSINTAGGLVGSAGSVVISRSYATGTVLSDCFSGGLIGQHRVCDITAMLVDQCYATGDVTGGRAIGGLIGLFEQILCGGGKSGQGEGKEEENSRGTHRGIGDNVTNCYATGNVYGIITDKTLSVPYEEPLVSMLNTILAGGLIGSVQYWYAVLDVSNCFATGEVYADIDHPASYAGGFIGFTSSSPNISNCFAFNPKVQGNFPGRVVGVKGVTFSFYDTPYLFDEIILSNNGANPCMEVWEGNTQLTTLSPTPDLDNETGEDIPWEIGTDPDAGVYTNLDWDFDDTEIWTFDYTNYNVVEGDVHTNLPILTAFNTQENNNFFAGALQPPFYDCPCPRVLEVCEDEITDLEADLIDFYIPTTAALSYYIYNILTEKYDIELNDVSQISDPGTYKIAVKAEDEDCESWSYLTLIVHEKPTLNLDGDYIVACGTSAVYFYGTFTNADGIKVETFNSNGKKAKITEISDGSFTISYNPTYYNYGNTISIVVTTYSEGPCESVSEEFLITVNPKPIVKWKGDCIEEGEAGEPVLSPIGNPNIR